MTTHQFEIRGDFVELFKILKILDLCENGGEAKHVISEGQVKVDGNVETRKSCKIKSGQKVEYKDNLIVLQ